MLMFTLPVYDTCTVFYDVKSNIKSMFSNMTARGKK